jgi:hypothetical protein
VPIQDLIGQLDTEIAEHRQSAAALTAARDALAQAQSGLDTASQSEAKEKGDVLGLWTRVRDEAQAEIDRLGQGQGQR